MTNDIEAAIDTAYGAAFGVGPMPTGSRGWFALGYRAALAHAARGEGEEAEVHRQLDEATRIVKPYYNATGAFVGGPGNWIAPVHACPKCGKSLNWREFGGGIVADCACGRQTSYLFHPTPPPATGDASNPGEKEER